MTITSQSVVATVANVSPARPLRAAASAQVFTAGRGACRSFVLGSVAAVLLLAAGAGLAVTPPVTQPPPPKPAARAIIVGPSSSARFQQTVQQQQAQDNLQKAQVEAQNRQGVSNNSQLPNANNPQMQNQINQSDAAQQNIERARQQDIINRYQATPVPQGRIIVPQNPPPKPANGG